MMQNIRSRNWGRKWAYTVALSACIAPLTPILPLTVAHAQDASVDAQQSPAQTDTSAPNANIPFQVRPPAGFEDLTDDVDTLFDVTVHGRRIGSFRAVMSGGELRFSDPNSIAMALTGIIKPEAVLEMVSKPLDLNEQYRCFTGQTVGCGLLPPGQYGAIVDPQRFTAELFFAAADAVIVQSPPLSLGPSSSSGLSLVQNVGLSFSSSDFFSGEVEYGGALDTLISRGSSAFIAQTLLSSGEGGTRLNQAHGQHIWSDRIVRAGLIENYSTSLLMNQRMLGADYGVFTSAVQLDDQFSATPLDVVLPRDADVEIRRNGVLLSVRRYGAGPQRLDTASLPQGSYQVSIIARADGVVVIDEIKSFSKAGGLPPAGKTYFTVGAGFFTPEQGYIGTDNNDFLPHVNTDQLAVSARISRRIGATSGLDVSLMSIDSEAYGEVSLRSYLSNMEGIVAVAAGSDGSYAASVNGSIIWEDVRVNFGARKVETDTVPFGPLSSERYRPFFRSENTYTASAQFPFANGFVSLSGSYTEVEGFDERYSASLRYSRPMEIAGHRVFMNAYAQTTDQDTRVGFNLSFGFGVGRSTRGSATTGAEYIDTDVGSVRNGLSPVASVNLARRDDWGNLSVSSQAGISTNADNDRIFASGVALSDIGSAEITAQHTQTRNGDFSNVFGTFQSGFAIGGGTYKLGYARLGDAVIIAEVNTEDKFSSEEIGNSGYRVRIDSQPTDLLRPGSKVAVGLSPYADYELTLTPENAPPFDADLTIRRATLYPGNVVRMSFDAQREYTLFGQLVDNQGIPISGVVMNSGTDTILTDDSGYFTLTVKSNGILSFSQTQDASCTNRPLENFITDAPNTNSLIRVGKIQCSVNLD